MREPDFNIVIPGSRRSDPETLQLVAENFRSQGYRIEERETHLAAWWPEGIPSGPMTEDMILDIQHRFLAAQGQPPVLLIDEHQVLGIAVRNFGNEVSKLLRLEQIAAWLDKQIRKVWK